MVPFELGIGIAPPGEIKAGPPRDLVDIAHLPVAVVFIDHDGLKLFGAVGTRLVVEHHIRVDRHLPLVDFRYQVL